MTAYDYLTFPPCSEGDTVCEIKFSEGQEWKEVFLGKLDPAHILDWLDSVVRRRETYGMHLCIFKVIRIEGGSKDWMASTISWVGNTSGVFNSPTIQRLQLKN